MLGVVAAGDPAQVAHPQHNSDEHHRSCGALALLAEAFGQRLARLTATQHAELKSLLEKLR